MSDSRSSLEAGSEARGSYHAMISDHGARSSIKTLIVLTSSIYRRLLVKKRRPLPFPPTFGN